MGKIEAGEWLAGELLGTGGSRGFRCEIVDFASVFRVFLYKARLEAVKPSPFYGG